MIFKFAIVLFFAVVICDTKTNKQNKTKQKKKKKAPQKTKQIHPTPKQKQIKTTSIYHRKGDITDTHKGHLYERLSYRLVTGCSLTRLV